MQENTAVTVENYVRPDFAAQIAALMQEKISPGALKEQLEAYHVIDISEALQQLTPAQRRRLYTLLPPEHLCRVLECSEDACVYLQERS